MLPLAALLASLLASFLCAPAAAARLDRPWTLSVVTSLPGGLGIDASYAVAERLAVGAQASSWVVASDIGGRVRWYAVGPEVCTIVVSGGVHLLIAPLLFTPGALAGEATLGLEYRAPSGFTLGGDLGPAVWISDPAHTEGIGGGGGGPLTPAAFAQARLGWSW